MVQITVDYLSLGTWRLLCWGKKTKLLVLDWCNSPAESKSNKGQALHTVKRTVREQSSAKPHLKNTKTFLCLLKGRDTLPVGTQNLTAAVLWPGGDCTLQAAVI